jgi:hypothetical protein
MSVNGNCEAQRKYGPQHRADCPAGVGCCAVDQMRLSRNPQIKQRGGIKQPVQCGNSGYAPRAEGLGAVEGVTSGQMGSENRYVQSSFVETHGHPVGMLGDAPCHGLIVGAEHHDASPARKPVSELPLALCSPQEIAETENGHPESHPIPSEHPVQE